MYPYCHIAEYDNCSAVASKQNRKSKAEQQSLSEAIARYESLAKEALKSGNALAANRNRFMAAVHRSMLDHS